MWALVFPRSGILCMISRLRISVRTYTLQTPLVSLWSG